MIIGIDIRNIGKQRTGDEVVFFNLVKNLQQLDKNNHYKLFTDIADHELLAKISTDLDIESGNNFEIVSLRSKNKFCWNFRFLPRYIKKNTVNIYLTQYIVPFFIPAKTKIITVVHDISFRVYKQFIKKSDLLFLRLLIPRSLRRADKIIAVSQFTRDEIIKYYKITPEKVEWMHNAVDDEFIKKAADLTPEDLTAVRKKYNLPLKFILYLGTLQPRKNIPNLIKAYADLVKKQNDDSLQYTSILKDIKLVIAGGRGHNFDSSIYDEIEKNNLQLDVIFPGYIAEEDKAALMKLARVFCTPSFYEGFGIPILEAMTAGTPVVASSIRPHMEIAGKAALFFDPQNTQELSDKLLDILTNDNLRQELIRKGFEQVGKFSWKDTAEKMLGIFESLK